MSKRGFYIESSINTPMVQWDAEGCEFKVTGKIFPENAEHFFTPLKAQMQSIPSQGDEVHVYMHVDYLNSAAVIMLLDLLRFFKHEIERPAKVSWCYDKDDEEMLKLGEDFDQLVELPFTFLAISV